MSGPRVTSGRGESRQDQKTPAELMAAVARRFGTIQFDLAAVASNAQHERYFAPTEIIEVIGKGKEKQIIRHPHFDPKAYGHDAFAHSWSALSRLFKTGSGGGLLWLNCEFAQCERWSRRCFEESMKPETNILLLTPAAIGSNWYRDNAAARSDTWILNGRVSFDGKNPFPKDCMLSHYHPGGGKRFLTWNWVKDEVCHQWQRP